MKKIIVSSLIALSLILSVSLAYTTVVYAENPGAQLGDPGAQLGNPGAQLGNPAAQPTDTATIVNPIAVDSIQGFIERLLGIILKLGIPLVALAIIYAGFKFVMAQGNASKLEEAKSTFLYTLIGAALLLGAWVIGSIVKATIEAIAKP